MVCHEPEFMKVWQQMFGIVPNGPLGYRDAGKGMENPMMNEKET